MQYTSGEDTKEISPKIPSPLTGEGQGEGDDSESDNLDNGCAVGSVDGVTRRGFGNGASEPVSSPIDSRAWDDLGQDPATRRNRDVRDDSLSPTLGP